MKKIFRLASVLALSGIALMYTGCTKDYDADIKAIETDLAELQSGTIADQSKQIAALQNQAAQLQTLANQYKQLLDGLEAKKADKTELASAISELQNSISGQIAQINTTIDGINEIIANKADKSWVEQTFATKNALAEVESDLGAVSGRVAAIEASLLGMGVDLGGIDTFIDQVNQTATQASQDAQSALGQVAEIQNSLAGYYTQGQVDELIDASIAQLEKELASKDSAISAQEKADKEMLLNRIKAVQKTLDPFMAVTNGRLNEAYDSLGSLEQLITALTAQVIGIDQAYKDADDAIYDYLSQISGTESSSRVSAIKSIRDSLKNAYTLIATNKTTLDGQISSIEANINKVNTALKNHSDSLLDQSRQILGLSNRIKSISVFPSKTAELYRYVIGNDSTLILTTTFQVRPAAAISPANLQNSTIKLFATNAKKRGETRSVDYVEYPVNVLDGDVSTGLLKIEVKGIEDKKDNDVFANKSELFFALQIEAQDTVGTYKVMSEYQNPVYGEVVNLKNNFYVDTNSNKSSFESDEIDYTLCKDTSFYAFNKGNSAIYVNYKFAAGTKTTTIAEFEAYTGMTLTVFDTVIVKTAKVAADTCALITPNAKSGFATMVDFKDMDAVADYRPYVGEKDTVIYEPTINGVAVGISYKHAIEIIKHIKAAVTKDFRIYWNYKNYAVAKSADTVKVDAAVTTEPTTGDFASWWSYCVNNGYGYIGHDFLLFQNNGKAMNDSVFWLAGYTTTPPAYDNNIYLINGKYTANEQNYSDTLKRESTSDRYNFKINVKIDALPVVRPASFDAGTVKFTYTKDNTIKFSPATVAAKFIGTKDNIMPYLTNGLSSYNYNEIFADFYNTNFVIDSVAIKNQAGAWVNLNPTEVAKFSFADSTNIVVTAGTLDQNKSYRVFASNKAFYDGTTGSEVLCKATFDFKTDAALLKLAYEPLVVTTAVAKTQVDMTEANSDKFVKDLVDSPVNLYFALAVAEGGESSNLTLNNMYAKNYLRVDTVANDVSEDYSMFTVDYEVSLFQHRDLTTYSLIGKPETSKLSVDALQKRINLVSKADADDQFFSFETAEGRAYIVKATLKCNGVSSPIDTKYFYLWTKAPLKLDVPAKYEGLTTLPGVDKVIDVASKIKVHNIVNGVYQTGSILGNPTKEGYYKFNSATDMKYEFVNAKCNGVDQPMTVGVHYTLNATTGEFVLLKDNVQGTWEINIKVTMQSWLDYKHYDFKTSQAGLQYGTITLVVNKAN